MELPLELKIAIEKGIDNISHELLMNNAESISERYRTVKGEGKRLITQNDEAATYSVVRMPATYGAVYTALGYTLEQCDYEINSLIDVGAGTGAASWAADSLINLKKITCLEREDAMIKIGKKLMLEGSESLKSAVWKKYDMTKNNINENADIVISSYALNELTEESRYEAVKKLWDATHKILLIVEPGTPIGYENLKKIREYLIREGGYMLAPCPHNNKCTIESWCHFTCRIPRSRLHKELKKGDVPYEDEKFSYIAVSKFQCGNVKGRILRHPIINKGRVSVDICDINGIQQIDISKKNKDLYKTARKAKWGDSIDL